MTRKVDGVRSRGSPCPGAAAGSAGPVPWRLRRQRNVLLREQADGRRQPTVVHPGVGQPETAYRSAAVRCSASARILEPARPGSDPREQADQTGCDGEERTQTGLAVHRNHHDVPRARPLTPGVMPTRPDPPPQRFSSRACAGRHARQQSNTDQQISFRNRWSSRTSSRIASGSCSRCQRHSRRPAFSPSPPGAAARAALIA